MKLISPKNKIVWNDKEISLMQLRISSFYFPLTFFAFCKNIIIIRMYLSSILVIFTNRYFIYESTLKNLPAIERRFLYFKSFFVKCVFFVLPWSFLNLSSWDRMSAITKSVRDWWKIEKHMKVFRQVFEKSWSPYKLY